MSDSLIIILCQLVSQPANQPVILMVCVHFIQDLVGCINLIMTMDIRPCIYLTGRNVKLEKITA